MLCVLVLRILRVLGVSLVHCASLLALSFEQEVSYDQHYYNHHRCSYNDCR